MKNNNKLKAVLALVVAFGIIMVGLDLKGKQGYLLDTQEQINEVISKIQKVSTDKIEILQTNDFQGKKQIKTIFAKCGLEYYFYFFEENENLRYNLYNTYNKSHLDEVMLTFRDYKNDVFIVYVLNEFHRIDKVQILGNGGVMSEEKVKSDEKYVLKTFKAEKMNALFVALLDEDGIALGDVTFEETTIN